MKKILISSDCNGNFSKIFSKVNQLNMKNKFDLMLMVGSVCPSWSSHQIKKIRNKQIYIPIPTYFIDCSDMSAVFSELYPNGYQIAQNFIFLGKQGIKIIQGLKICYVNGLDEAAHLEKMKKIFQSKKKEHILEQSDSFENFLKDCNFKSQYFNSNEVETLITHNSLSSIDILLTNQWPEQFENPTLNETRKSSLVSRLCYQLCPKYHITGGGQGYFRMNPFLTKKNDKNSVTHFINVAAIPPECSQFPKDKYLVAIQVDILNAPKEVKEAEASKFNEKTRKKFSIKKDDITDFAQKEQEIIQTNQKRMQQIIKSHKNTAKQESLTLNSTQKLTSNDYIYFEGFPLQTTDRQISEFLQRWGEVKEISIDKKGSSKFSRCGFCRFRNVNDAEICLSDSNRYTLYQNRIKFKIKKQNEKYRVDSCFLCIGNSNFDESLIVHIGKFCYIAVDKGPIEPLHYQIVPINHVSNSRELQTEQKQEIKSIQTLLINSFKEKKLTTISFERYANLSYEINHCIIHIIGADIEENLAIQRFQKNNISHRLEFSENNLTSKKNEQQSQFYIKLSINHRQFMKILTKKDRDLQLSRQIVCQILEKPQKLNWRDSQLNADQIQQQVLCLRKILKNHS